MFLNLRRRALLATTNINLNIILSRLRRVLEKKYYNLSSDKHYSYIKKKNSLYI